MASIPEEWQSAGYDETIESPALSRPASNFWRYYWLMTGGAGLLGIGLLFSQANPEVAGLLLLLAIGFAIVGLLPFLISTTERRVSATLSQRLPNYEHRWATAATGWWYTHWIMMLAITGLIITCFAVQPRGAKEFFVVLTTLTCMVYIMMIAIVMAWRWRRLRMVRLARLEELQSFEMVLETEGVFNNLADIHPIFAGKLAGRCPVLLRREVGGWSVLLFDWLDVNKQPPRREWITIAMVGLHQPLPMFHLQPHERVAASQLHWWHILLEFPFGLIIFLISAASHFANKLKSKPPLTIAHSPALTKGYQLDTLMLANLQNYLSPAVCQDIVSYVHKKNRFVMVNQDWLLLAAHKRELSTTKLGDLVADALRLADVLERARGSGDDAIPYE
ncbi:MAG TPA: hypothetical protein PLN21_20595 [Gemmatales bacterium]|nr:hypothetical protein [Gemmatales bacterium]